MPATAEAFREATAEGAPEMTVPEAQPVTAEIQSPIIKGPESQALPQVEFQQFQPFQAERAPFEAMLASRGMQMEVSTGRGVTASREVATVPGLTNVVNQQMAVERQGQGLDIHLQGADGRPLDQNQVNALMAEPAFKASLDRLTQSARTELINSESRRAFERHVNGPGWGERMLNKGRAAIERIGAQFKKEWTEARQTDRQHLEMAKGLVESAWGRVTSVLTWGEKQMTRFLDGAAQRANAAKEKWDKARERRLTNKMYSRQQNYNFADKEHIADMNYYYPREQELANIVKEFSQNEQGLQNTRVFLKNKQGENMRQRDDLENALRFCGEIPSKDSEIRKLENQDRELQMDIQLIEAELASVKTRREMKQRELDELKVARLGFGMIAPALANPGEEPKPLGPASEKYQGPEVPANFQAPSPLMPPVRQEPPTPVYSAPYEPSQEAAAQAYEAAPADAQPAVPEQQPPLAA